MPRAKDWRTYPEAFHKLIREAAAREVSVEAGSEKEARKLQGMLYAFHGSLRKAAAEKDLDAIELNTLSYSVQYRTEGSKLYASPKALSKPSLAIEAALGSTTLPVGPSTDLLAAVARLKAAGEEPPDE